MPNIRDAIDATLEALVVPSFTRDGYQIRRRLFAWTPLGDLSMGGRVVAVTGATSGLGEATATALAGLGAHVRLIARDGGKAAATRERIVAVTGSREISIQIADLSELSSVRDLIERIHGDGLGLDVLINNAGGMLRERRVSADGFELTFATMVLGPFVLTAGVMPLLAAGRDGRVVTVASGGMYLQGLHPDDLQMEREPYRGSIAYSRAKRAQVVLTRLWAEQQRGTSVVSHAMHPGWAATPGIRDALPAFNRRLRPLLRTPEQGSDTIVWLAAAPEPAASTGRFWLDRRPRPFDRVPWTRVSPDQARRLWRRCAELAGT